MKSNPKHFMLVQALLSGGSTWIYLQYEFDLNQMNNSLAQENIALANDNKQLSILLKEYEQTLETAMGKFRNQAHASQLEELELTRFYESLITSREAIHLTEGLAYETGTSHSLAQMSHLLRCALRLSNGESAEKESVRFVSGRRGYTEGPPQNDEALEKECELVRLEKENEELRRLLGVGLDPAKESAIARQIVAARNLYPPLLRHREGPPSHGSIGQSMERPRSQEWAEHGPWQRQESPERIL